VASDPTIKHKTGEVAEGTNYSTEGIRIHLQDLNAHGLLNIEKGGQGFADTWQVSEKLIDYVHRIVIHEKILDMEICWEKSIYANIMRIYDKIAKFENTLLTEVGGGGAYKQPI
jgi:hypothetical protein